MAWNTFFLNWMESRNFETENVFSTLLVFFYPYFIALTLMFSLNQDINLELNKLVFKNVLHKICKGFIALSNCLGHFRSFYKILQDKMNGSIFTKGLKEILGGQKKSAKKCLDWIYQRWFCSRILVMSRWWTVFCAQFNLWVVLIVTPAKKGCPTGRDCALIMKLGMIRNIFRKFEIIKVTDAICIHYCPELKGVFEMVILSWLSQHQLSQGYLIWTWL